MPFKLMSRTFEADFGLMSAFTYDSRNASSARGEGQAWQTKLSGTRTRCAELANPVLPWLARRLRPLAQSSLFKRRQSQLRLRLTFHWL